MLEYLNKIRKIEDLLIAKRFVYPLGIFVFGIILGVLSKILDESASSLLPSIVQYLDLRNFFSRMGIWIFIAVLISIYSHSPIKAGVNVILFFIGMISSYYLYTIFIAGFFPRSYMMIWVAITLITPFLAAICWYAKGTHIVSIIISSFIYAVMGMLAFALHYDFSYFHIKHGLEFLLFLISIPVLYVNKAQIIKVILIGSILFVLLGYTPMRYLLF